MITDRKNSGKTPHHRYMDAETRFWNNVEKTESGCWLWTGFVDRYGHFKVKGKMALAHRFSYELHHGPIPGGLHIDHLCRNKKCVNPAHLEAVTPRVNAYRGISPAAINRLKTHCVKGHPLSGDNLLNSSYRRCRECERNYLRAAKKRADAKRASEGPPCPQNPDGSPLYTGCYFSAYRKGWHANKRGLPRVSPYTRTHTALNHATYGMSYKQIWGRGWDDAEAQQ